MTASFTLLVSLTKKVTKSLIYGTHKQNRGICNHFRRSSVTNLYCKSPSNNLPQNFSQTFSTDSHQGLLTYKEMPYDAIQISINDHTVEDSSEFATRLYETITYVKSKGKVSIMITFPIVHSHLIPIAGYAYIT